MSPIFRPKNARRTLLAMALLSAFGSAQAQLAPAVESSVAAGIGLVSGDRQDRLLLDQYSGLRPGRNVFGIFGAEYYRRDDTKGTVVDFRASDLLTGNRELGLRWKKQGDWKFSAEYRELVRRDTLVPNSGLTDAGSSDPVVALPAGGPGTGDDIDLKVKRTQLGLGFSKVISSGLQLDASVQTEKKEGSRLWGTGFSCPSPNAPGCRTTTGAELGWAALMVPEPINANHSQAEARLSYSSGKLNLSGGYYGSFYRNDYGSLNPVVPDRLFNNVLGTPLPLSPGFQPILNQAVALPPDNQAHHLDLTGSYALAPATLLNFKLGYSRATQDQNFAAAGFAAAPAGVSDLGGKMTTGLAQVGFTSRPMARLSLSGNLRYEDRDDDTPLALYNIAGTDRYTNRRLPYKNVRGKLQAGYQFSTHYRGTLGASYESIDRGVFTPSSATAGITALRQETEEAGLKAELRRRMSENFSGALSLESSRRDGSNWLRDSSGLGVSDATDNAGPAFTNGIFMPTLADRKRDKLKLQADWQASEALTLQFIAEAGKDRFSSPSSYGLRDASMNSIGVDLSYAISDKWSLNGYVSRGRQQLNQARADAAIMAFDNTATTFGLGFTGKPTGKLEVGGMLSFINDKSEFAQSLDATANLGDAALLAATGGLPDIVFRQTTLKFFGKYTLDKQSAVRLEVGHQRSTWNDWAWSYNGTPFVYTDGTIVNRQPRQRVSFIGVSYIYRWQ
ncbi:MAG: MtrB/PioB family decaheme-associated outer membrane protein [Ramlibacter sp.]|nr:MtrB/PioB family decaheme-associated outer membrane protein [Ramlibacter sp.]